MYGQRASFARKRFQLQPISSCFPQSLSLALFRNFALSRSLSHGIQLIYTLFALVYPSKWFWFHVISARLSHGSHESSTWKSQVKLIYPNFLFFFLNCVASVIEKKNENLSLRVQTVLLCTALVDKTNALNWNSFDRFQVHDFHGKSFLITENFVTFCSSKPLCIFPLLISLSRKTTINSGAFFCLSFLTFFNLLDYRFKHNNPTLAGNFI